VNSRNENDFPKNYAVMPVTGPVDAVVAVPGSKSLTNRALVAAALADGTSLLTNVLSADDTRRMVGALRSLGIRITWDGAANRAEVTGCGGLIPVGEARLLCGNAGTVMRFLAAMAALGEGRYELDGDPRMRERPIGELVQALRELGAGVEFVDQEGFPPLIVHARGLSGGTVSLARTPSSQFISAILLSSPYARSDVMMDLPQDSPSRPFLRMTTAVMEAFGVGVVAQYGEDIRFIVPAPQRYQAVNLAIEPDATNATYFWAAAAVAGGRVTVEGLGTDSVQGDVRFVDVLELMGCRVIREPRSITVEGPPTGKRLRAVDVDLKDMPDTAPTLAVTALFAAGRTSIRNVGHLRIKETDRLAALRSELTRLGAAVEERTDGLTIHPPDQLRPATIETYDDHRMAMSFALAGLKCPGVVIHDPGCCGKTFPGFFARFEGLARSGA